MAFIFNLLSHLEKFKTEDGYDLEKAQASLQEQFNNYDAKNKPDMEKLKTDLTPEIIDGFIKGLEVKDVENVDQFNAYVKRLGADSTELTEANGRLTKDLEDKTKEYDELMKTNSELTGKITGFERKGLLATKGFNDKYANAVIREAESRMTEEVDFAGALDLVKKDFPEWGVSKNKGFPTPSPDSNDPENDAYMRGLAGLK